MQVNETREIRCLHVDGIRPPQPILPKQRPLLQPFRFEPDGRWHGRLATRNKAHLALSEKSLNIASTSYYEGKIFAWIWYFKEDEAQATETLIQGLKLLVLNEIENFKTSLNGLTNT